MEKLVRLENSNKKHELETSMYQMNALREESKKRINGIDHYHYCGDENSEI